MASVISVMAKVQADSSTFVEGMKTAENSVEKLKKTATAASKSTADSFDKDAKKMGASALSLGKVLGATAAAFVLYQGVKFLKEAVAGAADFETALKSVNGVFGSGSQIVQDFAKTAATSVGLSEKAALEGSKSFGAFAKLAGLAEGGAAKFSTGLVQAAGDLGSFYGVPTGSALTALEAGLRGQAEPLKQFGILLDTAEMNSKSMELGLGANSGALNEQEKILVRHAIIMDNLGDAQGNFAKESDKYGNSIKTVGALFENLQKDLGGVLLPILAKLAGALVPIIQQLGPVLTKIFDALIPAIDAVVNELDSFMPVLDPLVETLAVLAELFSGLMQELLPPLVSLFKSLLPPIVKVLDIFARMVTRVFPPLIRVLDSVLMPILEGLIDFLESYALPILDRLADVFGNVIVFVINRVVDAFELLRSVLEPFWNGVIKPLLDSLMSLAGIQVAPRIDVTRTITNVTKGSATDFDFDMPTITGGGGGIGGDGGRAKAAAKAAADARAKAVKDTAKMFADLLKTLIPVKVKELGAFEQAVVDSFKSINKAILKTRMDKIITKQEAQALRAFSKEIRTELRAIAAERDAVAAKLANLQGIKDSTLEFVKNMSDLLKGTQPLARVEIEIGRFQGAVITAFDNINSKIEDGLSIGLFTETVASQLRASAATTKKALSDIGRQRDQLAKSYMEMVDRISAAREFKRSTKEAITGFANITAMGRSARSMIIGLGKLVRQTDTFAKDLSTLQSMGLTKRAFNSILEAGATVGGATAKGLIKGGKASVDEINKLYGRLEAVGDKISSDAEVFMFDGGETAIVSYIQGIVAQDEKLRKQAESSATAFNTMFQTTVNAAQVSIQSQIDALLAQQTQLEAAATTLAEAFNAKFAAMLADFSQVGNQAGGGGGGADTNAGKKGSEKTGGGATTLTNAQMLAAANRARNDANRAAIVADNRRSAKIGAPMTGAQQRAAIIADNRKATTLNINVKAGIGTNPAQVGKEITQALQAYKRTSGGSL